ncbi:glutathione hydrolase 1 proenzyme-like isoform X1 [Bolinopsis microptera]|uniref:glutathione hydrolase 1 proenzyme-like isoform X1 n=1 Tax=Bolinopsis microptera TaxID=2820187 RepID=UPI00307AB20B
MSYLEYKPEMLDFEPLINSDSETEENGNQLSVQYSVSSEPKQKKSNRKVLIIGSVTVFTLAVIVIIVVVVTQANKKDTGDFCKDCLAVASDNDVCTKIGAETLRQGGSGVDATIAILLCLGAVQPQSNGIGGGGFMLIHTKTEDKVINFRERAPAASTKEMYVENAELAKNGGLASAVPGEVRGYWTAHQMYGKLPWKDLFTPSIQILRSGIEVSHHMEKALKIVKDILIKNEHFKSIFFNGEDSASYKTVGETYTNPKLADAYEKIADEGPDGFYKGEIAENIVKATKAEGGIMTLEDLEGYNVTIDEPFKFEYRGQTIISAPPPASGHVIALALQVLDNFDLSSYGALKAWNYIIEAMRFGYAMRSRTGDPDYSSLTKGVVTQVKDKTYMKTLLKGHFTKDSYDQQVPYTDYTEYSNPIFTNYDGTHTTHVSVMGPGGEAVACTSTVNLYFGARVMTDNGIVMNNEMDDFSTPGFKNAFGYNPSPENFVEPGKRPMSSSSPSIVFDSDGEATFVTGAAGGSRIISGVLLSLVNAMDWKMPLDDNLRAARIHDQLNQETLYEVVPGVTPLNARVKAGLSDLGYNMTERTTGMSSVNSVSKLWGRNEAEGDPRKNGTGIVIIL